MARLTALAIVALSLCAGACGGSGKSTTAPSHGSSASDSATQTTAAPDSKYAGDGEGEIEEGIRSVGYRDADDGRTIDFGHAAGRADTLAVTSVVKRYQAAAAAGDARRACAVMTEPLIKAVGVDYDRTPAHRARRSKTCEGGMVFLFKTDRARMIAPSTVTGVRVKGNEAYALLGSPTVNAAYLTLQREHGRWWLSVLLTLSIA